MRSKIPLPLEDQIHKGIGTFLRTRYASLEQLGLLYYTYSPAGEKRHIRTAVTLKKKGVKRGDPDYRLEFAKDGIQYTLYVEVKRSKRSYMSKEQKAFFEKRSSLKNVKCSVAYGVQDFADIVTSFITQLHSDEQS